MSNIVDTNVSNFSMKNILETMATTDEKLHPVMQNPFNTPGFSNIINSDENEIMNIHKNIKLAANSTNYEKLAEELRQNAGYGDYEAVEIATKDENFLHYCDLKDENGFTAIKWAGDMGYHRIVKLLLNCGAKPYRDDLKDFININFNESDIQRFNEMDTIDEGDDEDNEIGMSNFGFNGNGADLKPNPHVRPLPSNKKEKKEMLKRMSDLEKSSINKNVGFGILDGLKQSINDDDYNGADMTDDIIEAGEEIPEGRSEVNNHVLMDDKFANAIPYNQSGNIPTTTKDTNSSMKKGFLLNKSKKPNDDKKTDKKAGFGAAFAKNLAKNFSKTDFSENRHEKFVLPNRKEVTPEEIQDMIINRGLETFRGKSNEFLEEFSSKDVTKYLMNAEKIQPMLRLHRTTMCSESPVRADLYQSIKNNLEAQKKGVGKAVLNRITDSIYEMIKFYLEMYHRLIDIGRVEVRDSPIHGKGVFATRKIKRGDVITFYFPYFLNYNYADIHDTKREETADIVIPVISRRRFEGNSAEKYDELFKSTIKIPDNFYLMGDDEYISDSRFLGHMVNDPCNFKNGPVDHLKYDSEILKNANATVVSYTGDRRYIYVGAMRDIEINEEILVPYGGRYWGINVPTYDAM